MSEDVRKVVLFKRYFDEFFDKQPRKVQEKLYWSIKILGTVEDIPKNHLKSLPGTNDLMEKRTQFGGNIRIIRNIRSTFASAFDNAVTNPSFYFCHEGV